MATLDVASIPNYKAGTWNIDPTHSQVSFSIRHLMVSKVKGKFGKVSGQIVTGENISDTKVTASMDVASVTTGQADRDGHLQSPDFFDVAKFPTIEFVSTGVTATDGEIVLEGELTMHGVTKPVSLPVDFGGIAKSPYGQWVMGAESEVTLKRSEFGLEYNAALESGGVLLGDDVKVTLEIEAGLAE